MIYSKYYRKWSLLAILIFASITLCTLLILPTTSAAKEKQISADQLKSKSRLSFTLRDANQTSYTVYIFADDEQKYTLTEPNDWTNNKTDDKSYSGTYRAVLLKKGAKYGTVQTTKLPIETIILPQTWNYTIKGKEAGTPDMLMLTDWGTSNFNEVHTYIIRSGVLQPIKFTDNKGKKISGAYWASRNNGIRSLSGSRVQFKYYNNMQFKYAVDTFKLNVSKLELRLSDTRYVDQSSWPNSGMGDRAYLESLKAAASKGMLPGRSDIKIGMTLKSVQSNLNKPKSRGNEEWGAFYYYSQFGLGFDSYMHELNAKSRIAILQLYNEKQNLAPQNVRLWLGKPSNEYYNEAAGGYEMTYRLGKHTLVFNYEEEDDLIDFTNIY
ncbi:DUF4309 domain-containing protein [Paenibacillus sp. OK003]|uniref:DUF4309 domain-containing protein n=1 Tax=Paenibacillus sp. OK003 TaxID=1884380 RepID=UPI0008CEE38A|nr:DUF4309 domain-containing protein [Paenibacillus sp. OK003]SEL74772.1 protein of unknown function [Paenibacillus sp. OK003]